MQVRYCSVCGEPMLSDDEGRHYHRGVCMREVINYGRCAIHHCQVCGVYISQPVAGSVRYTCGSKCRQKAYRNRKLIPSNSA